MSVNPLHRAGARLPVGESLGEYRWGLPAPAAQPAETAAPGEQVSSDPVRTGLRRFQPENGLFLKAEHLSQIQDYAADLAALNAVGGGAGVVYGYTLELDPVAARLRTGHGLASAPSGRPLRCESGLTVDLSTLDRSGADRVWVVEVVAAADIPDGSEPVYSSVCATSCRSDSTFQPWRDEAVRLRVRAETLDVPGMEWRSADDAHRGSAVASAYFERERRRGGPWFTPTSPNGSVAPLRTAPWRSGLPADAPAAAAANDAVPVGLLWVDQGDAGHTWRLDVWAARRDRVPTPPDAAWAGHLARRSPAVASAQLLQFQDQLAGVEQDLVKRPLTQTFLELPSAGFLPRPADGWSEPSRRVETLFAMFGRAVVPLQLRCTADTAVAAVEQARHLDRIPLVERVEDGQAFSTSAGRDGDPAGLATLPWVLVLVPDVASDLPQVRLADGDAYPWIAFVRLPRIREIDSGTLAAGLRAWLALNPSDRSSSETVTDTGGGFSDGAGAAATSTGEAPGAAPAAPASAPTGSGTLALHVLRAPLARSDYAAQAATTMHEAPTARASCSGLNVTVDDEAATAVRAAIDGLGEHRMIDLLATTADPDGQALAAARAVALAGRLGIDLPDRPVGVSSRLLEGPDAVFLLIRKR